MHILASCPDKISIYFSKNENTAPLAQEVNLNLELCISAGVDENDPAIAMGASRS
jgi:hypothetical protein